MFKKILVPLDGSPMAEAILPYVRDLAQCAGPEAEVVVLQINSPIPSRYYPVPIEYVEVERNIRAEANTYVHQVATNLMDRGIRATAFVKDDLAVADTILDYADHSGADLIAMSTHGRTGIGRWLLGSVADRIVHGARVPVLMVRPDLSKPS